jgi:hypothetical protein
MLKVLMVSFTKLGPQQTNKGAARFISGSTINKLIIIMILAAGLGFGFFSDAREWALYIFAYGWIPVIGWLICATAALRYRPKTIVPYWRRWVIAAASVTVIIATLSLFSPGHGLLSETSLGGRWGKTIGGTPLVLGLIKIFALIFFTPFLVYPHRAGRYYLKILFKIHRATQSGLIYLYPAANRIAHILGRSLRQVFISPVQAFVAKLRNKTLPMNNEVPSGDLTTNTTLDVRDSSGSTSQINTKLLEPTNPPPTESEEEALKTPLWKSKWHLPSMDILARAEFRDPSSTSLETMARHIETTLADHGVMVAVKDIKAGPRVVRFGLVPGWLPKRGGADGGSGTVGPGERSRVKVQSILTREKDLALALKTPYLRIEAPVPGESLVGLEVPTPSPSKVPLRAVMDTKDFQKIAAKGGLPIAVGQDTGGNPITMDLTVLPHLLIAGATGSGKSVCINSIIASMLLTRPPDQLRMLMVDPKRVELTPFNGIPHLITPVIVETDEVVTVLQALMREMLRRYKQMEEIGARNILGYNSKARDRMPYLVLIVDELADLMIAGGFAVEQTLIRLAQLGRATGIHLVLATQRPSVNVVTGLLKANIVARVAFAVASQVDSRVILDAIGAEKLLGKGDMLLLNNDLPKPRRVQGTLVYDEEISQLAEFWTKQKGPPLPVIPLNDAGDADIDQEQIDQRTLDQARELALRNPYLSSSYLERRLKIGGLRARQIMEELDNEGLIIPR